MYDDDLQNIRVKVCFEKHKIYFQIGNYSKHLKQSESLHLIFITGTRKFYFLYECNRQILQRYLELITLYFLFILTK